MNDKINPKHYKSENGMQVIDVLEMFLTPEEFAGFCKGNIIKYTLRSNQKNGVEDIKKAEWYSNKLAKVKE